MLPQFNESHPKIKYSTIDVDDAQSNIQLRILSNIEEKRQQAAQQTHKKRKNNYDLQREPEERQTVVVRNAFDGLMDEDEIEEQKERKEKAERTVCFT